MLLIIYFLFISFLAINAHINKATDNVYEAFGYDPSCIAVTLGHCLKGESPYIKEVLAKFNDIKKAIDVSNSIKSLPHNCADLMKMGKTVSGVYTIYPHTWSTHKSVEVYCDQDTNKGGWTVFQKRDVLPEREDFFRTWIEYTLGFGNVNGEYWLGLENIHALVNEKLMELRIDLEDFSGNTRWASYKFMHVGDANSKYELTLGKYFGNANDSLSKASGMKFTTIDQDNDIHEPDNCAKLYKGGWWYIACHQANLNGYQHQGHHDSYADGINWSSWKGFNYSLKRTQMSIRPAYNYY